ncbi:MAG: hypothetical protein LBD46_00295 [Endomicrobium sp.]|jgi:uncharacterized ion transporter superfamily protein YfcC|nr:hypothetical protein [Endomicrobium sp.]
MKIVQSTFVVVLLVAIMVTSSYSMSVGSFNKAMKDNSSKLNKVSSKLSKLSNRLTESIKFKYKKVEGSNREAYFDSADVYVKEYIRVLQEAADKAEAVVKEFENKQY